MSGILSYNLVTQNSGYADIPKVLVIIGFFVIVYLIVWQLQRYITKFQNGKPSFINSQIGNGLGRPGKELYHD